MFILILLFFLSSMSYASTKNLNQKCKEFGGNYVEGHIIVNDFVITDGESMGVALTDATYPPVTAVFSNSVTGYLYDMVKQAKATGKKVNVCLSRNDEHIVGLEWNNNEVFK